MQNESTNPVLKVFAKIRAEFRGVGHHCSRWCCVLRQIKLQATSCFSSPNRSGQLLRNASALQWRTTRWNWLRSGSLCLSGKIFISACGALLYINIPRFRCTTPWMTFSWVITTFHFNYSFQWSTEHIGRGFLSPSVLMNADRLDWKARTDPREGAVWFYGLTCWNEFENMLDDFVLEMVGMEQCWGPFLRMTGSSAPFFSTGLPLVPQPDSRTGYRFMNMLLRKPLWACVPLKHSHNCYLAVGLRGKWWYCDIAAVPWQTGNAGWAPACGRKVRG